MRPVRRAESIVHIIVAKLCQRFGKHRIVRFFAGVKTQVLEQRDVARTKTGHNLFRIRANAVVTEDNRMIDEIVKFHAHRPERIFRRRFSLRTAKVRHQNCFRALFSQIFDRRQTFTNARVIGDDHFAIAFFQRHIEIDPHQHAFIAHVEIANGQFGHDQIVRRSAFRAFARNDCCNPIRYRTSRRL